ncbi:uncharacterized protein PAN0_003d1680 [Moesziomyces antarcticus]|uniref:uncharacterized protein n=1 Tax=Pseudozyma antarctica TaxID=84753 RepID=UPI000719798A|nr:uncharacterized protein PAN0_003d1680 [Moesziomyces antarcticus]GAK63475.1 hypothetical protein PAN0_003d1680 [Moesziomyces antarcticus]
MDPSSKLTLSQRTRACLHTRDLRTFSLSPWACSREQQRPMHWRTASASNPRSLRLQCLLLRPPSAPSPNLPWQRTALCLCQRSLPSSLTDRASSCTPQPAASSEPPAQAAASDIDSFPSLVKLAFAIFFSPTPSSSPAVPFLHPI